MEEDPLKDSTPGQMKSHGVYFDDALNMLADSLKGIHGADSDNSVRAELAGRYLFTAVKCASWALSEDLRVQFRKLIQEEEIIRKTAIEQIEGIRSEAMRQAEAMRSESQEAHSRMMRSQWFLVGATWIIAIANIGLLLYMIFSRISEGV